MKCIMFQVIFASLFYALNLETHKKQKDFKMFFFRKKMEEILTIVWIYGEVVGQTKDLAGINLMSMNICSNILICSKMAKKN